MFQGKSYQSILHVIIIVELMTAVFFVGGSNATFQLSPGNQDGNAITLKCTNANSGVIEQGAIFFLNNTELTSANYPSFMDEDERPGEVTFQINRQLEGMYSCGIGQVRSNHISLITYPTNDASIIRRNNEYFAIAGDTAILECPVSPGALIHYYRVIWRNGNRRLFRQSLPSQRNSSTFPDSIDPRYRLNPVNLSLIIDDVRRGDSIQDYHCILEVFNPTSGSSIDEYAVASNENISLTVFSPPIITEAPHEETVSQGENAIFRCKAQGYPLPEIFWMHNGRIVTDHHPDYLVIPSINDDNTMVSSDLRIFSVSVAWTGKVTCIASTNSPEGSGITLTNHTANTSLTVLGQFRKFDVLISTDGDVIFSLVLPTEYDQSIHLFLKYTNEDNPKESYNRTTEIGFLNTKSVQYMEYSSQVYYDRFQIAAGLVSGSREVLGPLYTAPGVYDTTRTTFCESGFNPHYTIIFGVFSTLLIVLCIVLVVVICIVSLKKDNDLMKYVKSHKLQLEELKMNNTRVSETNKDSPEDITSNSPASANDETERGRVRNDGTERESDQKPNERRTVESKAHRHYKSNPVYSDMKKVLKGANLPERKYKIIKKQLMREFETPLLA